MNLSSNQVIAIYREGSRPLVLLPDAMKDGSCAIMTLCPAACWR